MIYLDNAATTPITKPVLDAMMPYLTTEYGNPSSLYSLGRSAKEAVEIARERIATAINAEPNEIFFTSGATESNNIVARSFKYIVAHDYDHHSISNQPNRCDNIAWDSIVSDYVTSQTLIHNETGDIFKPLNTTQMQTQYHIDATQAFSHYPVDVKELDCDYLSLSGHKFHSVKGVGILYVKSGNTSKLKHIYGGNQERGFRTGTENIAGIVAMGVAAELYNYTPERNSAMESKKEYLINLLYKSDIDFRINSLTGNTVPNIVNISIKGVDGESVLLMLDNRGICVSVGSACNSDNLEPSEMLKTIEVPDEYIYGTIRISMSDATTYEELKYFVDTLKFIVNKLINN